MARSRASWIIRLIGGGIRADNGQQPLRRDQVPKSDVDQPHRAHSDVLDLLADLFQLRLDLHDGAGLLKIVALRADGVGLAVHLLQQEVELAADGPAACKQAVELGQMAAQTDGLLIDGDAVGKDGGLRQGCGSRRSSCRRAPRAACSRAGCGIPPA